MQRLLSVIAIGLVVLGLLFSSADAAVPVLLQHQGRLLDASDAPLDGFFDITYAIFELPVCGAPLRTEVHPARHATDGLFSVTLGSVVTLTTDILAGSGGAEVADQLRSSVILRYASVQPHRFRRACGWRRLPMLWPRGE